MGLYYQPPLVNVGSQQPLQQRELIPPSGPAPQNPPIKAARSLVEILDHWYAAAAVVDLPSGGIPQIIIAFVPPPLQQLAVLQAWQRADYRPQIAPAQRIS